MYNEMMDAVVRKLEELFPDAEIGTNFRGEETGRPYFEVGLLETSEKPVNGPRYFRSISMYIKYYPLNSEKISCDLNLVLDILMDKLEYILLESGSYIRGSSRNGKNEGGILNFLVDYQIYFLKTNAPEESMEEIRFK